MSRIFDEIDKAIGACLNIGDKAFEAVLLNPLGDIVGTLCGDSKSASNLAGRVLMGGISDGVDVGSD